MTLDEGVVICGTDTGVGKTFVAAMVLCALRRKGKDALPMKLVQTGADAAGRSPDLDFCLSAAGLPLDIRLYDRMAPYRLPLPASPHLAARQAGVTIAPKSLIANYYALCASGRPVVIECAGGLLVPITPKIFQIDIVKRLNLPVILVARAGLGTINHTLLSVEALARRRIRIIRVILNASTPSWGIIEEENVAFLRSVLRVPVNVIPYVENPGPTAAAELAASFTLEEHDH